MVGATLVAAVGLLRLGLIDRPTGRGLDIEPPASLAPTVPVAAPAGGTGEAEAVRVWLRKEMGEPASLDPGRVIEILEDLDEDPDDKSMVALFPSGRAIPKAELRARAPGWEDARLWPASRGLAEAPAPAMLDLHNLRAAEPGLAELLRARDFDDGGEPSPIAKALRIDGDSLEPPDPVKGDVARALFYMAVRYDGTDGGPALQLVRGASAPGAPQVGRLCALLQWNEVDPVDAAERRRNDWVTRRQGSRNPFVDRPEFARVLWGKEC
jgi:endonuclease I